MDLFCCGMYRSCSTWQYEVALEIMSHRTQRKVQPLGYLTGPEYARIEKAHQFEGQARVFKGHEGHPAYTRAMFRGKAIGLYAHRDIRDVIYSLMHKRNQSFQEIVRTGMIHQILVNDRFWRAHPQVLVQRYDDIMAQPAEAIIEIAEFLQVRLPIDAARKIADAYSKEANLSRTAMLRGMLADKGTDLADSGNAQLYDPATLLHWNHIRPVAESWRECAMPQERMIMQKMLGAWLSENGYAEDYFEDLKNNLAPIKSWRIDAAQGLLRCHSREFSARYDRIARPIKRFLGLGQGESRSRPAA